MITYTYLNYRGEKIEGAELLKMRIGLLFDAPSEWASAKAAEMIKKFGDATTAIGVLDEYIADLNRTAESKS